MNLTLKQRLAYNSATCLHNANSSSAMSKPLALFPVLTYSLQVPVTKPMIGDLLPIITCLVSADKSSLVGIPFNIVVKLVNNAMDKANDKLNMMK